MSNFEGLKMELTSENVNVVLTDCFFRDGENSECHIRVEGIMSTVGSHPGRLESHREDVATMLKCLPDDFQADKGGGMSFLNACLDENGRQWGEHVTMEGLFLLGIGLDLAQWQLPREAWSACPGGMPYVVVK